MSQSHCLIIARSGRALAKSAVKAGYQVHVIDAFADLDTQSFATSFQRCRFTQQGFESEQITDLVSALCQQYPITVLALGSGIERSPELIKSFNTPFDKYCNSPECLHALLEPERFFSLLDNCSVPHPETSFQFPVKPDRFLCKQHAGMGGEFVRWNDKTSRHEDDYYQDFIAGDVCSVVFLADGNSCEIIGFNRQWQLDSDPEKPFLYRGAYSIDVSEAHHQQLQKHLLAIIKHAGLKGLCGMDYIVDKNNEIYVLEVNPRPPASFELHEGGESLFEAHIKCFETLLSGYRRCDTHKACVIIYADKNIKIRKQLNWPSWTKDIPAEGTLIKSGEPVCTVHAEAENHSELHAKIEKYSQDILSRMAACEVAV